MAEASVRIAHLKARGLPSRETTTQVLQYLEHISWPATDDWIVVRDLKVSCGLGELGPALQRAVDEATAHATRVACGAPAPDSSVTVRFVSVVDRVAALTLDLALGSARDRWYWQRQEGSLLEQRAGAAIATLWGRYVAHLPEICSRIAAVQRLAVVFTVLSDSDVTRIADEVWSGQVRAPSSARHDELSRVDLPEFSTALVEAVLKLVGANERFELVSLAATLVLAWQAPLLLNERSLFDCRRLADSLAQAARSRQHTRFLTSTPHALAVADADPPTAEPETHRGAPTTPAEDAVTPVSRSSEQSRVSGSPSPPSATPAKTQIEHGARRTASPVTVLQADPVANALDDASEIIATPSAGIVFLVNAIRHPGIWGLLGDLGLLGGRYHGWSLWRTIAEDMGLAADDPAALWLRAECEMLPDAVAPPSPSERAAIHVAARNLYGAELWSPRLVTVTGTLRANQTHIDVHLPLASVRIGVRTSGLDLNPGWVSWLGRVVTIHYHGGIATA